MWNANSFVQVWTKVTVFLPYDNIYYTTSAFMNFRFISLNVFNSRQQVQQSPEKRKKIQSCFIEISSKAKLKTFITLACDVFKV